MRQHQGGFTLIELVMVIVILGILAATALPRFADLSNNARVASVNGMLGGVQAASAIAHSAALVAGQTGATGTVTLEGTTVNLVYGYPRSATTGGIDAAVQQSGFTYTAGTPGVFALNGAPTPATCSVSYTAPAAANTSPTITSNTAGC